MLIWIIFQFIIVVLALLSLYGGGERDYRFLFKYTLVLALVYFSGFRDHLGSDYYNYIDLFQRNGASVEPFTALMLILYNKSWFSEVAIFLIYAAITNVFFVKSFYRYDNVLLILVIYILSPNMYFNTFNLVRQMCAASLFMYSVIYVERKDGVRYFLIIIIASLIHSSAIYLLPLYFILNKYYSRYYMLIVLSISALVGQVMRIDFSSYISGWGLLLDKYELYLGQTPIGYANGFLTIIFNVILVLILLKKEAVIRGSRDNIAFNAMFLGVILYNLMPSLYFLFRFAIYFIVFYPVVFAFIGRLVDKKIVYAAFISLHIVMFGNMVMVTRYSGYVIPKKILPLSSILK